MSRVAIKGNASGTGTFTLEAPNSNTDRTLTLPDEAGTIATTNGITMADQYRLTADKTSDGVLTLWEQPDDSSSGTLGSSMTVSSGVFSFPETGIYLVDFRAFIDAVSGDNVSGNIEVTINNSSFDQVANAQFEGTRTVVSCLAMIDVTDISQVKVRFSAASLSSGSGFRGDTDRNETHVTFIRLGDT